MQSTICVHYMYVQCKYIIMKSGLFYCIFLYSILQLYCILLSVEYFYILRVFQFCVSAPDSRSGQLDRVGNDTDGRTGGMQDGTHYIPL